MIKWGDILIIDTQKYMNLFFLKPYLISEEKWKLSAILNLGFIFAGVFILNHEFNADGWIGVLSNIKDMWFQSKVGDNERQY